MKRIALLINRLSDGGAEKVASDISTALTSDITQYLFVVMPEKVDYSHKCEVIDLDHKPANSPFRRTKNVLRKVQLIYRLKKLKKKYSISTTISFGHYYNVYNILSASKDRVILTVHTLVSKHKTYSGFFSRMFLNLLYNRADSIVSVSKCAKKDLTDNNRVEIKKVKVIYNPCDIGKITELSKEPLDEKLRDLFQKDVIISAARISPEKGQDILIRAFAFIKEKHDNAALVFLGSIMDHEYCGKLKKLVTKLSLQESVLFVGFDKNPYRYISRSRILALTSYYEGFGLVLVEAMACGVPVVSVDCKAGPREILSPSSEIDITAAGIEFAEYGILTPPAIKNADNEPSVRFFADACIKLLTDEEIYINYKQKIVKRAIDFDISEIIKQYEELIV
jgi:glycosyltransferase involved in cell wall biosynthesis